MNNRLNTLFKMTRKRKLLGRRRNNRSMLVTSLIGLGAAGAAAYVKRNRNNHNNIDLSRTVQNAMSSIQNANLGRNMASAMAELSNELMPKGQKR